MNMAIIKLQRAATQTGRIRIGQKVVGANGKTRPTKLDTFRFTTASLTTAHNVAEVFGGQVRPWENQFEVVSEADAIGVTVPPRDEVISQHMEMWTAGIPLRRCDSVTVKTPDDPTGRPCLCPADPADRTRLAAQGKACKPTTRLNVMIPVLRGFGVWRLDTGGYYAAVELADIAEIMQAARDRGIALPAMLRIDQRERQIGRAGANAQGHQNREVRRYPVPVLEPLVSYAELVSGKLDHLDRAALLPPAPGDTPRAITGATSPAGPAAIEAAPASAAPAAGAVEASPASTGARDAAPAAPRAHTTGPAYTLPQQVADAAHAARSRDELTPLIAITRDRDWNDANVLTDPANPDAPYGDLEPLLRRYWRRLPPTTSPAGDAAPLPNPPPDE